VPGVPEDATEVPPPVLDDDPVATMLEVPTPVLDEDISTWYTFVTQPIMAKHNGRTHKTAIRIFI
jgi:hypothetical protein